MKKGIRNLFAFCILLIIFFDGCSTTIKLEDSVFFNVSNMTAFLKKTRTDVNQMLGDEEKYFEATSGFDFFMTSDVYEIDDLPLAYIHLYYKMSDYIIEDFSLDANCIFYQPVENISGVEVLDNVSYVFQYDTVADAELIWGWVLKQKEALIEYFGRTCDFENNIGLRDSLKDSQWPETSNWMEQWIFDVEGSDKKDHKIAYCYMVSFSDNMIHVTLDINQSYSGGLVD